MSHKESSQKKWTMYTSDAVIYIIYSNIQPFTSFYTIPKNVALALNGWADVKASFYISGSYQESKAQNSWGEKWHYKSAFVRLTCPILWCLSHIMFHLWQNVLSFLLKFGLLLKRGSTLQKQKCSNWIKNLGSDLCNCVYCVIANRQANSMP